MSRNGATWKVACDPHVAIRLKRVFPKARPSEKEVHLSATPETSEELRWFLDRYPLRMDARVRRTLFEKADAYSALQRRLQELAKNSLNLQPPQMALPPRPYQLLASEVAYATGRLLLADELGLGKALAVEDPVLTPTGWRQIGDLRPGDLVVDPNGGHARVEGVFPQGVRPLFRVTTKDGASVLCSEDHLWEVQLPNDRNRKNSRVVTTGEMLRHGCQRTYGGQHLSQWFLPLPKPVKFGRSSRLPLDAYLLGALLGDGHFKQNSVGFSNKDRWILQRVAGALPSRVRLQYSGFGVDYRPSVKQLSGRASNPLVESLRGLGLMGHRSFEKYVPEQYLRASPEHRLALLQGLMDTDGDCTVGGVCIFNTTSERLKDAVVEIVRGLGGIASVSSKIPTYVYKGKKRRGRLAYRVNIRLNTSPFSLPRKAKRWRQPYMCRAISSIRPEGSGECVCIKVSSKRELFVTRGHIVTHNTVSTISLLARQGALPAVVVLPKHLTMQWTREIQRFLPGTRTYVVRTTNPEKEKVPKEVDVWIVPYSRVSGWAEHLRPILRTVVFDEVHELRREESDKYASSMALSSEAAYRIGCSATPIWNYGAEFYAVLGVIAPGALGSWDEFAREWCSTHMERRKTKIKDPVAFGAWLRDSGIMLRRTRRDVGRQLPPVVRSVVDVEWSSDAFEALEEAIVSLATRTLTSNREAFQAAGQLDGHVRMATGVAKAPHVAALVRGLLESSDDPVVLFGWHRACYDIWLEALKEFDPVLYTGTEDEKEKDANLQRFIQGKSRVLIMSLRSGQGVDGLQGVCHRVVFGELDWSPGALEQCLDAETEILTKRGFMGPDNLRSTDVVAAFQLETGEIVWAPVKRKVDRLLGANEKMYAVTSNSLDLRVTGNHRMVYQEKVTAKRVWSEWRVTTAAELAKKSQMVRLPMAGMQDVQEAPLSDDELRFLGWFLSDGHFAKKSKAVTIAQDVDSPYNDDIRRCLDGANLHYTVSTQTRTTEFKETSVIVRYSLPWNGPVRPNGKRPLKELAPYLDRNLSSQLEQVSARQLAVLLEAMHLGDGCKFRNQPWTQRSFHLCLGNRKLAERLQSLCVRRGWRANISRRFLPSGKWYGLLRVKPLPFRTLAGTSTPDRPRLLAVASKKDERVWCVENEQGTLVVRRHGKVAVVGNCLGRVHRDGQPEATLVYYAVCDEGSDPIMLDILDLKRGQHDGVIDPQGERLLDVQVDPEHIKRLATEILKRRNLPLPVAKPSETPSATSDDGNPCGVCP